MEERLKKYKKNQQKITEYEQEIAEKEKEKIDLDEEIRISSPSVETEGRNKKSYVSNNIEPQVISREGKIKQLNREINQLKAKKKVLIAYQEHTRTLVKCNYTKIEQDVIEYRFFNNYKVSETAKALEITESAVQKIQTRILKTNSTKFP